MKSNEKKKKREKTREIFRATCQFIRRHEAGGGENRKDIQTHALEMKMEKTRGGEMISERRCNPRQKVSRVLNET